MKILFPYLARWRSANRSRYHQLLTHLCELGHQVYVLTAPPMALNDISANDITHGDEELPPGITISELYAPESLRAFWCKRIPRTKMLKKGLLSLTSIGQIRRFTEKEKIDVLLLYNLPQAPLMHLVECRTHFDLADDLVAMMEVEDSFIARAGGMLAARAVQRRMIRTATTVTVASSVLEEQIKRRVLMLPNGADLEELDQSDGSQWRSKGLGLTVGFVGAFEYWVDFDLVLDVAQRLPNVNFLLVGGGRQWNYVHHEVSRLSLKNVHLTGAQPYQQAMNYVAGMDVCLLPFKHSAVSNGSCPLKLFEYAAMKKPIVSTSTDEVNRIGAGWIAFADDDADFAAAIEHFLTDRRAAESSGETGRALVERLYNWPHLARRLEDLLSNGEAPGLELAGAQRKVVETLKSEIQTSSWR